MKLILENWRRYLKENDEPISSPDEERSGVLQYPDEHDPSKRHGVAQHNIKFLLKGGGEDNVKDMFEGWFWKINQRPDLAGVTKIVDGIPTLSQNKIKRVLGAGNKGVVFELDNDHAFKLYVAGYLIGSAEEGEREAEFYASEKDSLFDKTASPSTLPVYDQGEVKIYNQEGDSIRIRYAEIAKVITFQDFMESTGREPHGVLYLIISMKQYLDFEQGTSPKFADRGRFLKQKLDKVLDEAKKLKMTPRETSRMIAFVSDIYIKKGADYLKDMHSGNFGILQQSVATGKPVFVQFDP